MLAPGVAQLAPQPYLALNQDDAGRLQALEGEVIVLDFGSITSSLPLRIVPSLPRGVAGLPVGLPGLPYIHLPRWSRLMKREGSDA